MKKSTPAKWSAQHHSPNSHIFVTRSNWPIETVLRGHAVVLYVDRLEDISETARHKDESTKIVAYVYEAPMASLETIEPDPAWGDLPVILCVNRLGQYRNVHHKIGLLKGMNVMVIFTGALRQACIDAQILSSLQIHSGVALTTNSPLDDEVQDLMTYYFYSAMPHAQIEPFATLERYYCGTNRVSPAMTLFNNPSRYIHIDKDCHLAFTKEDLEAGRWIEMPTENLPTTDELLRNIGEQPAVDEATHAWQQLFVDSHPCTFCPAFRVCMGFFACQREGGRCREVMLDMLEGIEFHKKKTSKNREICQL